MKCSAVHLLSRTEFNRWKLNKNIQRSSEPVYLTKGYQGYDFTFLQNNTHTNRKQTILSVNDIHLPVDACPLNAGYSLTRWSNKIPRLKSATKNRAPRKTRDIDSECDTSYDINNVLDDIDNNGEGSSENNNVEDFEIHSDIEELIRQSQEMRLRREEQEEKEKEGKHKDKSRKRKHRLKKTIRFSFSKPASPQTEQVIRVDVTSNISVEELMHMESSRSDTHTDDRSKNTLTGYGGKVVDRNFNEKHAVKFNGEDEEFIIRCRQLALTHKRR